MSIPTTRPAPIRSNACSRHNPCSTGYVEHPLSWRWACSLHQISRPKACNGRDEIAFVKLGRSPIELPLLAHEPLPAERRLGLACAVSSAPVPQRGKAVALSSELQGVEEGHDDRPLGRVTPRLFVRTALSRTRS